MSTPRGLVVAKAPVPGFAKTRLAARVGAHNAAELAAAALLDTLAAVADAFGECHLALAGDVDDACRSDEIRAAVASWHVFAQEGTTFGDRLAHAHRVVAGCGPGPVVQVGMDTPQVTASVLAAAVDELRPGGGVLGPAEDGGWWLLGLDDPTAADVLPDVVMSTDRTGSDTRRALAGRGVALATTTTLCDVDTIEDAEAVALVAPLTRFATAWSALGCEVS